jgi:hypothetical protein
MPRLYNLRHKHRIPIPKGAIYCGRGTPYGNPFIGGTHGSRARVIERFKNEVLPDLDVSALRGKDLVCWCVPLPCHCESIMEKANAPEPETMLPDGLWESDGKIMATCRGCDRSYEYPCDPDEDGFDPDMSYCGGSPRCCP